MVNREILKIFDFTILLSAFIFAKAIRKDLQAMFKWIKKIFEKEEVKECFIYRCPRCYSVRVERATGLAHTFKVFNRGEDPKKVSEFKCNVCGLVDNTEKMIKEKVHGYY